ESDPDPPQEALLGGVRLRRLSLPGLPAVVLLAVVLVPTAEPLPRRLACGAQGGADPRPGDAPLAQPVDPVLQVGVDLGADLGDAGQHVEDLLVGQVVRPGDLGAGGLPGQAEDVVAEPDALVADVDAGAGDEPAHLVLGLGAERAADREPGGHGGHLPGMSGSTSRSA